MHMCTCNLLNGGVDCTAKALDSKLARIDEEKQAIKNSLRQGQTSELWQELEREFEDDVVVC